MDDVRCVTRRDGSTVRLLLSGRFDRVDQGAHLELRKSLRRAFERSRRGRVVVDLAGVESIGSECIEVLLVGYTRAMRDGHGFEVVGARGAVRQALEITGFCPRSEADPVSLPSAALENAA